MILLLSRTKLIDTRTAKDTNMSKPSKLKDYRKWFKNHFSPKELKAIVAFDGLNIASVSKLGYQVRIELSNGKIVSETWMTKEQLIQMTSA